MTGVWAAAALSGRIAAVATAVTLVLAVPLAWGMARWRFAGRGLVEGVVLMPVVLPPTVVGYVLLVVFGANGVVNRALLALFGTDGVLGGVLGPAAGRFLPFSFAFTFTGAVVAAVVVALPLFYLPAKAAFAAVDRDLEDVATLMGATRWQTFWHVSVPLARRGLVSGTVLAFARALGEFGATVMVFGWQPGRLTLPISVYAEFDHGDLSTAWPAVAVMAGASLGLVLLYNALATRRDD